MRWIEPNIKLILAPQKQQYVALNEKNLTPSEEAPARFLFRRSMGWKIRTTLGYS